MGESYMQPASIIRDAIRLLFATLDHAFYSILQAVYELFFNVASAEIISDSTITTFFGRIQLILGVFMLFQLAMTILKGIVNPDSFMDAKTGAGNLITRIITALVLLTMLVPLNIPANNEYEEQVRTNGILFGTLYSLQHRLLANNTLGKLIFGNNSVDYVSADSDTSELRKSSKIFTATVMKSFYRINLLPEDQRTQHQEGKDDAIFNANRVCQNIDDNLLSAYTKEDADPDDIAGMVNETCLVTQQGHILPRKMYAFTYMPLLSLIVAIVFIFILISFSVDVAVRAIKLAVLRLIAPIPIIGYMDPKGSKDSSFNAWTKAVTSTYLDLFIRLASVYFVIFLISDIIRNGIVVNHHGGILGFLTTVLIFIGLFVFAKQAPKFIKEVLGLKGDTGNIFGGLSAITGSLAAAAGTVGSARTNYRASKEENAALHPDSKWNEARNVVSAIAGGIGGGVVGAKALMGKDGSAKAVIAAQNQRNAQRAAHSTGFGRMQDSAYGLFTGQSLATGGNNRLKGAQEWVKAQSAFKSALEEEAKKNGKDIDLGVDSAGNVIHGRYEELERAVAGGADANGQITFQGHKYDVSIFGQSFMDDALKKQVKDYQSGNFKAGKDSYQSLIAAGGKLYSKRQDAIRTAGDVDTSKIADEAVRVEMTARMKNYRDHIDDIDTYGKAVGAANTVISEEQNSMRQRMRRANEQKK